MRIFIKHIIRNIRKNILSGILIIISLVIATAVVYLALNVNSDVMNTSKKMFAGVSGGYDVIVSAKDGKPIQFYRTKLKKYDYFAFYTSSGTCEKNSVINTVTVNTDLKKALERGLVSIGIGEISDNSNDIGISIRKAAFYDLRIGDRIKVRDELGEHEYRISVIYSSMGLFADERSDYLEILIQNDNLPMASAILVSSDGNSEKTVSELSEKSPEWDVKAGTTKSVDNDVDSISKLLYFILALSVIMGYYVISSVSKLIIDERMPVIGTFRSVGASKAKMNLLLIAENAVYGVFGGIIGVIIGEIICRLMIVNFYGENSSVHSVNVWFVLAAIAFAVLLQVIIALTSIIRVSNMDIKDIIFRRSSVKTAKSKLPGIIGAWFIALAAVLYITDKTYSFYINIAVLVCLVIGFALALPLIVGFLCELLAKISVKLKGKTVYLALKNIATEKMNTTSIVLTAMVISLGIVIAIGVSSLTDFMSQYKNNYPFDVIVNHIDADSEKYAFIKELDGVESIHFEKYRYMNTSANGKDQVFGFVCAKAHSNGITILSGDEEGLAPGHVIMDEILARTNDISVGDTVTIGMPDVQDVFEVKVDGFCDSGVFNVSRTSVIVCPEDYETYCEGRIAYCGINLAEGTPTGPFITLVASEINKKTGKTASVFSRDEYVSNDLGNVESSLGVLGIMPLMTALLAILGLVNNQIVLYNRKRREYAVLYSVCMSRRQLMRLVVSEVIIVFLLGIIFGALLSVWMSFIMRNIIFGLIAFLKMNIDYSKIMIIVGGTFAILCASSLIPRRMMSKMNIVEEIKYDE